ncbi:unnamed protein product [Ectocarpus sp. 13 AM-2016]
MLHVKDNTRKTKTHRVRRSLPLVGKLPVDTSSSSKKRTIFLHQRKPDQVVGHVAQDRAREDATRLREHHVGVGIASLLGACRPRAQHLFGRKHHSVVVWQSSTHSSCRSCANSQTRNMLN